jgi:hypothetical protein
LYKKKSICRIIFFDFEKFYGTISVNPNSMPKTPIPETLSIGKKILTSFILFTFFLTQSVSVNFLAVTQAFDGEYEPLISIIIDEDTYDALENEVDTYAKNITSAFPQSRSIIYKVASNVLPYKIASLNEKLYNEGSIEQKGRLIGTVLIGSIPLPVVHTDSESYPSVYPYVDFQDKAFVYSESA